MRLFLPRLPSAPLPTLLLAAAVLLLAAVPAAGQDADDATRDVYRTPAQELVDLVDAPPTPRVSVSPDRRYLLVQELPSLPGIEELAERELRLAGLRIRPRTHGPSRERYVEDLRLVSVEDGSERAVQGLPEEAKLSHFTWSPGGAHAAFAHTGRDGIELWVLETATARARRLGDFRLNLAGPADPEWLPSGDGMIAPLVVPDAGPEPPAPKVPGGPVVRETTGEAAPARTYQDLLENPHDEALFEHYLTAQLARVGLDGAVRELGRPGILWDADPSPDGRFLLVETLHRPFSYLVPAYRFPRTVEVWNAGTGETVRMLAALPLQEGVPIAFGSVPTGPRSHQWRADADAEVLWAEALDDGDASKEAEERDRLFLLAAPFEDEPTPLATLGLRFGSVEWGRGDLALVSEWWWKTRRQRVHRVRPDRPEEEPELLFDRSFEDRYNDPGQPVTAPDPRGRELLVTGPGGESLYLVSTGASPEGNRPFLDLFDLETKETRRLFRSRAPYYEEPAILLDPRAPGGLSRLVTRREAQDEPPNFYLRTRLGDVRLGEGESPAGSEEPGKGEDGSGEDEPAVVARWSEPEPLTDFPHPTPQLRGVHKELVTYERDDGVQLSATLYLPEGYDPRADGAEPLPVVMWAYPREFKSADAAGQVTDSPHRFDRVGWWSPLVWLVRGYAVFDGPTMPIVGEGEEEPNDTYLEQLVASAAAAVDHVAERGVGDRDRVAIGGHSYGAFMAANLLAHSDLFAAGIARSGAYNRTLTPFGFQAEERTLWEAPEVYFRMSPFMHAEKIDEPILLIHGAADNNSGTYPMQSERFYAALKGLGGTARLVMLPHESHGYRARESVLHMLWETDRWLETYVKNPPAEGEEETPKVEVQEPAPRGE